LATGSYEVQFSGGNYATQYYSNKSTLATANSVSVTAGSTTPHINATMVVAGEITGTVTHGATGIPNADVSVLSSPGGAVVGSTTTASDGTYTVAGLGIGTYDVQFSAPGYVTQFYNNKSTLSSADPVSVTAGGNASGVNAALVLAGQITGTVTDGTSPLQNVEVGLYDSGNGLVDETCTASNGTYTLADEAAGSYHVGFNTAGDGLCGASNYLGQYFNGKPTLLLADAVTVTSGATTPNVNATMSPGGQITGTVTDGTNPLQNIEVDVYDSGGTLLTELCTAANGTYTASGLATGVYHVGFNTSGLNECGVSTYLSQYYNNKSTLLSADPVSVVAGSPTTGVNATMLAGGHITGTVTDGTNPLENIEVDLYNTGGTLLTEVCTAANGTYTIDGLASGSYRVGFNASGDAACGTSNYRAQYYNGQSTFGSATPVSVTAPSTTPNVNAALSVGAQISGQVTDKSTGAGVPFIDVELFDSGGGFVTDVTTDSSGNYTLAGLPDGSYKVEFFDGAGNYATQYYNNEPNQAAADLVQVTSTSPASGINAALVTTVTRTLTVGSNPGSGSGTVTSSPAGISCGATCAATFNNNTLVTLTAAPAAGSVFAGWSGGGCSGASTTCNVVMSADQTVTATFNTAPPVTHALTVAANPGSGSGSVTSSPSGIDCGATCSHAFDDGTLVTLTESPAAGSAFAGWSGGGCSGTSTTCQVTLSSDQTVTPAFNTTGPVTHVLTIGSNSGSGSGSVTSSPSGIDCGATCSHAFDDGTLVTLTESPATGSVFSGWSGGGCSGTRTTCQVTLGSDQTVTPTFDTPATHTLTVGSSAGSGSGSVTSSPSGINCGATCLHAFVTGSVVTLTETPAADSTFAGWSGGGCAGTSTTCQVTMSSNQSVTATFNATGGGGGGSGGGGGGGSGGGGGGPVTPAPKCTLAPAAGIPLKKTRSAPAGTLAVTVKCNENTSITVSGTLTIRSKSGRRTKTTTASLGAVRAAVKSGVATIERLKLPASAMTALRRGASESALISLIATNVNGTSRASATVRRLRRA
jgi:hypothetical protein